MIASKEEVTSENKNPEFAVDVATHSLYRYLNTNTFTIPNQKRCLLAPSHYGFSSVLCWIRTYSVSWSIINHSNKN